jgi:hypothetical protein
MSKICTVCKTEKSLSDFGSHSGRRDGKQTYCKQCAKENQTSWYYKRKHGISLEQRDALLEKQGGKCAICKSNIVFSTGNGRGVNIGYDAVVDHCHETNQIRGVLCGHCNTGLGAFKDNLISLDNAITYLIKAIEK